ncbi:unnamed protein product, partial [Trichogramma brassicae]
MFLCTCLFKPLATIDDESDAKFDIVLRDLGKSKSSRDNGDRKNEEKEKSKSSRENNNCKIEEEEESAKSLRENNNCKTEEEESAKSSRENKNCKTEEEVSAKSSRENEDCKIEEEEQKSIDFSLHSAIKRGLMHEMEILLRVGADPNSANDQKSTPLHLICANDVGLIKHFLDTCKNIKTPVQVNAQDCKVYEPPRLPLNNEPRKMNLVLFLVFFPAEHEFRRCTSIRVALDLLLDSVQFRARSLESSNLWLAASGKTNSSVSGEDLQLKVSLANLPPCNQHQQQPTDLGPSSPKRLASDNLSTHNPLTISRAISVFAFISQTLREAGYCFFSGHG